MRTQLAKMIFVEILIFDLTAGVRAIALSVSCWLTVRPQLLFVFVIQGFCADVQRSANAVPRPSDNGRVGRSEFVVW